MSLSLKTAKVDRVNNGHEMTLTELDLIIKSCQIRRSSWTLNPLSAKFDLCHINLFEGNRNEYLASLLQKVQQISLII